MAFDAPDRRWRSARSRRAPVGTAGLVHGLLLAGLLAGWFLPVSAQTTEPKIEVVFVKYNLLKANRKLSVVKNDPVKAGEENRIVLTLFNSGSHTYHNVTIRPVSRDRYLNVHLLDNTRGHFVVDTFRAEDVRTFTAAPLVVTVAPTCPDAYNGIIYLVIECDGYTRGVCQFVVEVSNEGILHSSPDRFSELYGALGVKPPPGPQEAPSPPTPREPDVPAYKKNTKKIMKGRDSHSINEAIKKYELEIYYCYQQQLRKFPQLKGKVVVKLTIRPWGDCINVRVVKSTLYNKDVESCLIRRIKTWKFPTISASYGNLDVTYPFMFENKKR